MFFLDSMGLSRIENESVISILGVLAVAFILILWVSPLPTIVRIWKDRSTGYFSCFPYLTTVVSTSIWLTYGIVTPDREAIIVANGAGLFLSLCYCGVFLRFSVSRKQTLSAFFKGAALLGSLLGLAGVLNEAVPDGLGFGGWIGLIGSVVTIGLYGSPLSVVALVVKLKNSDPMPFWMSWAVLLTTLSWLLWGISVGDIYLVVPNSVGVALGILQVSLFVVYPAKRISVPSEEIVEVEVGGAEQEVDEAVEEGKGSAASE